jgi:hypothetical protein
MFFHKIKSSAGAFLFPKQGQGRVGFAGGEVARESSVIAFVDFAVNLAAGLSVASVWSVVNSAPRSHLLPVMNLRTDSPVVNVLIVSRQLLLHLPQRFSSKSTLKDSSCSRETREERIAGGTQGMHREGLPSGPSSVTITLWMHFVPLLSLTEAPEERKASPTGC